MKIAWNSIVKNESKIIERCVRSLLPHIDSAMVVDTGSVDGTPDLIKYMFEEAGKPVEICTGKFVNFEQARNGALDFARGSPHKWDFLLLSDADMELVAQPGWHNGLTGLAYDMRQVAGGVSYYNRRLVSWGANAKYVGVTHEYLDVASAGSIETAHFIDHADGANRPDKAKRDIALLEAALKTETNPGLIQRYTFYLAQSYFDIGDWDSAALRYSMRVGMGGWDEEVWNAQLHYAHALQNQGKNAEFLWEMLKAYEMRPQRAEVLYDLAKYFRELGAGNHRSLLFSGPGLRKRRPGDLLFVNDFVYKSGFKEEYAVCAYYDVDQRLHGEVVCDEVALSRDGNLQARHQARFNQYWYLRPLKEHVPSFDPWLQFKGCPLDGYAFTNPSVINRNGEPVAIVRAVNYKISPEGNYVIRRTSRPFDSRSAIHTRNFFVSLASDEVMTELVMPPTNWQPVPKYDLVLGFEDSRLFEWNGDLWTISCVRELNREGWCEQVLAPLGVGCYGFDWKVILPKERCHEKNWVPFVVRDRLQFMYRPGVLVGRDGETNVRHECKWDVEHFSGGSQVIEAEGVCLALVHEACVGPDGKRYYQHRFVQYKIDGAVDKISLPFVFFDKQIEFAAGLAYFPENKQLMASFGVRDEEAWFAKMDVIDVLTFIECSQ